MSAVLGLLSVLPTDRSGDLHRQASAVLTAPEIPPGVGWHEIRNTQLASVCPDIAKYPKIHGAEGCAAVINDWSGGIADTTRNRLVIWGGGHGGYGGNELYAFDLNQLKVERLNDPSYPAADGCLSANPDGTPNSRHTYGGLVYLAASDQLFAFNGSLWCSSGAGPVPPDGWTIDFATLKWKQVNYSGISPGLHYNYLTYGNAADFDPTTKLVYAKDGAGLFSFNPLTSVWIKLSKRTTDYHMTAVIDSVRRLFLLVGGGAKQGGGMLAVDIGPKSRYEMRDWNSEVKGCSAITDAMYPGLAYDTAAKAVVGWSGGDSVYVFDPDSKTCVTKTYPGGPGPQVAAGTNGRFRYFPALDVFALVNGSQQNAFLLRLRPQR